MSAMRRKDYAGPLSALRLLLVSAVAGDIVTINGISYVGVSGEKADDSEFSVDTSDTAAATDLADSIQNDAREGTVPGVTLTVTSDDNLIVITSTQIIKTTTNSPETISVSSEYSTLLSLASNVPLNNETLKRVNLMNTPYSVQSTGVDKYKRLLAVTTAAIFNTLTPRMRVLWGNRECWIKTATDNTSIVYVYKNDKGESVETTKTMAEVIASGSMFITSDIY